MNARSLSQEVWRFRDASRREWLPAKVPGCVHTDLLAIGRIPDPFFGLNEGELQWIEDRDWEYRTTFAVSGGELSEEVIDLVADGLDTIATVFLNGAEVGQSENMFVGHRWSVKPHLRRGRNELRIHFRSAMDYVRTTRTDFTPPRELCDPVGNSVRIRKQPCQFGWDWGPRFVTAGIWRDLRLEGWTSNRLAHVQLGQLHEGAGVKLRIAPEFERIDITCRVDVRIALEGHTVAEITGVAGAVTVEIPDPQLWWPAGQGLQPLYDVILTGRLSDGSSCGVLYRRIGLRTIVLDRHADEWGESFQFVVNGRTVFAKGANWIPAHSFVTTLGRADYGRDLQAAVAANMNCVRLWGGGIYESEHFYDWCDELGLLVWHDFIFACALYPSDERFLRSVEQEATHQVRRLHHRACLALWCGNNELAQLNAAALQGSPKLLAGYEKLFHELLPKVVNLHDGLTSYWPSSEWRGMYETGHAHGEKSGDSHFWDVWHARHPVKDYERWAFRFCSEFGMQSYSSPETNATFTSPKERNVFGLAMENHQKNRSGNQVILDYVCRRYRFPKSQDHLIYLSQLNQAYCMQVGVEHYRRLMPRCMGSLYWQLNDCWPVASWSSIEFTGRWKALHYAARRFYAPALVSAHVLGDETTHIGNIRQNSVREIIVYTVYDAPAAVRAELQWELLTFAGKKLMRGSKRVILNPRESIRQRTLDLGGYLADGGRDRIYLKLRLSVAGKLVSSQAVLFAPPRFLELPRARTRATIVIDGSTQATITFHSDSFQHAFAFDLKGIVYTASDNFFDLHPDEPHAVRVTFTRPVSTLKLSAALTFYSLTDSYE